MIKTKTREEKVEYIRENNPWVMQLEKDGFIVHHEQAQELIITVTKGEAVELSQTIEKLQRKGNFSPYLRDLNRKLIQFLKAVKHYGD